MKEEALKLLSQNYSPVQVAAKLGVTESYISQFMAETEFASQVAHAKLETLKSSTDRDKKWNDLEDLYLEKLRKLTPNVNRAGDVIRILGMVNKAERRGATAQELARAFESEVPATVNLTLPEPVKLRYKLNTDNEVIDINGRPLVTADSRVLLTQQLNSPQTPVTISQSSKKNRETLESLLKISKTEVDL